MAVVIAGAAVGIVRVLLVVSIVKVDNAPTVLAGGVVVVVASAAEIVSAVALGIVAPYAPSAMTTDHRIVAEAICAECLTVKFVGVFLVERRSAHRACSVGFHNNFLQVLFCNFVWFTPKE